MSELEHCRLAHEGKLDELINKIESSAKVEDLVKKKDQVEIYHTIHTLNRI